MAAGYLAGAGARATTSSARWCRRCSTGGSAPSPPRGYAALQLTLGVDAQVSLLALREIVVQGLLGVLLAVPFFPLIRRVLRPALVDDTRARRARSLDQPARGVALDQVRMGAASASRREP